MPQALWEGEMLQFARNITIDGSDFFLYRQPEGWDVHRYENRVAECLRRIFLSRVGLAMRHCMRRHLHIRPYCFPFDYNATTSADNLADAHPSGTGVGDTSDLRLREPGPQALQTGTGRGSSVTIDFTPLELIPDPPRPRAGEFPRRSDLTLAHEMAHGIRNMWGVRFHQPLDHGGANWYMSNSEEYFATIVANMYASEQRYVGRLTYMPINDITPALQFQENPRGINHPYVQMERRWIRQYYIDIPPFVWNVERIPRNICPYNPFLDYREGRYTRIPAVPMPLAASRQ